MNLLNRKCSNLGGFIGMHLDIAPGTVQVVLLVTACLEVLVLLSSLSCSSPVPTPPTATLTPHVRTPTLAPLPTLHPPVTLIEPGDDACLDCGAEVALRWSCPYDLEPNEYYQVRVRTTEQDSSFYHKEDRFPLSPSRLPLSPGEYNWAVIVVRSLGRDIYELVSEESEWYHFHIAPPSPVVHSISPPNSTQGISVSAVISGENFTLPLTLTIDVPLQANVVNSRTITATIPNTLQTGEYTVTVTDSNGKGQSFASFAVNEPPMPEPPSTPVPRCWNLQTPVPAAPPGYDPHTACVVTPCAPAPQLDGPDDKAELTTGSTVEFRWTWVCCLPPGWKFAIRLSAEDPPHSWQYMDDPAYVSCQGGMSTVHYPIKLDPGKLDRLTTIPGTYYWNIAVARSVEGGWERLSQNSEVRPFTVVTPPPPPDKCPVPPCP